MIGQKGIPARSGGIERHVESLTHELAALGHEIVVYCRAWYSQDAIRTPGIHLQETGGITTKHLDAITHSFTALCHAALEKVDIVHIHGVGPALLAPLARLLLPKTPIVVTFHSVDRDHEKWGRFARWMLKTGERCACHFADATIAVSESLRLYAQKTYGQRTIYLPNGVSLPSGAATQAQLDVFGLKPDEYVLMCARLVRHKGAHTLIDAWQRLSLEQPKLTRGKKLVIVGGSAFTDGYVDELKAMAAHDPRIVLTGPQYGQALHALFSYAHSVVHPSVSEGLPIAILEAMSYGKTVLAANIPENLELTKDYGRSFTAGSTKELTRALSELLTLKKSERASIGAAARTFVKTSYQWKEVAQSTSDLYRALAQLKTYHQNLPTRLVHAD